MKVQIVSTIKYSNRILAMIDISTSQWKGRTYFYRSTGTNVDGKGEWFPCTCLAGPGQLKRTYMHQGWIAKDLITATPEEMEIILTLATSYQDHSDKMRRWTSYPGAPFDILEAAREIRMEYEATTPIPTAVVDHPAEPEDIEFINTWITKGLVAIYNPKEEETGDSKDSKDPIESEKPKALTKEEEDLIMRSFMI